MRILLFLMIFISLSFAQNIENNPLNLTNEELAYLEEKKILNISSDTNYPPYDFVKDGKPTGYSTEYMRLLGDKLGIELNFIIGESWSETLQNFCDRKLDILHASDRSEKAKECGNFSIPQIRDNRLIVTRKNGFHKVSSSDDLIGYTMVTPKGWSNESIYRKKYGDKIKYITSKDIEEALELIRKGEADFTTGSSNTLQYFILKNGYENLTFHTSDLKQNKNKSDDHFIVSRKDEPLLESVINKAMNSISMSEKKKLREKWFKVNKSYMVNLFFTQEEQDYLNNNNSIRFTGDPNWLPFEAFDKDGKYVGIVADNLKLLEKKLDLNFEKIVSRNWTNAIDMAMSGNVDVISGDAADDILNLNFHPIESYIKNPIVIIMKNTQTFINDLYDLEDKKIAIIKDYGYTADIYKNYPNIEFREVENIQEALLGIETRKYDVVLASLATSSYFISEMALKEVVIVGKTDIVMNVTLFVNKNKPLLHSILNKTMQSISLKEHQKILSAWNNPHSTELTNYDLVMKIVAAFVILILFFLYRQFILAKHNKKLQESKVQLENLSKKLQSSHDMLSKLTENVPGVIYQYKLYADGHSCFPYSSNEIEDIYEVKSIDVIEDAQAVFDVIHPDDLGMVQTSIENSAETMNDWNLQYRVNLVKNGIRWIEGFAKPERLEDGSILWHGFIHDITEEKRKDEILLAHSRNAAMGEMIGMIAHQWRQPLAAISMSMNNMLADIELEMFDIDTGKDYAKEVIDQNQHLSKTIDDFRNFFQPDKDLSTHTIEEILEQTYSIIQKTLLNNNIEFKTSIESKSEIQVYPRELMQVFVNIINNAKDALMLNDINNPFIDIKVYENDQYVITDIYDNANGIDEKVISKVFDPYFSTKDAKNGTGLGLYMSKMIIENHLHGKIEAINTDNGVCFRVLLKKSS